MFVTVTFFAPTVALSATVTGTVIVVAFTNVAVPTVMFASLNETVAPALEPCARNGDRCLGAALRL